MITSKDGWYLKSNQISIVVEFCTATGAGRRSVRCVFGSQRRSAFAVRANEPVTLPLPRIGLARSFGGRSRKWCPLRRTKASTTYGGCQTMRSWTTPSQNCRLVSRQLLHCTTHQEAGFRKAQTRSPRAQGSTAVPETTAGDPAGATQVVQWHFGYTMKLLSALSFSGHCQ